MLKRNRQILGQHAEDVACDYLQKQGLTLLARNFRCRCGEIDLIMRHNSALVFIEVRLRNHSSYVSGADSVDGHKQGKIIRAAEYYLQQTHTSHYQHCRFDVLDLRQQSGIFKTNWVQNAFTIE
ncbi:MAG: YraN family protein [Pseudomonadota bacterium]